MSLTVDLLSDFRKGIVTLTPNEERDSQYDQNRGSYSSPMHGSNSFMQTFFADVDIVKKNIQFVMEGIKSIELIMHDYARATTTDVEEGLIESSAKIIGNCNKSSRIAKEMIGHFTQDNVRLKTEENVSANEMRVRETLTNTLMSKFVATMKHFQLCQQDRKVAIKLKVTRQLQIVKPTISPKEVDEIISTKSNKDMFKTAILEVCMF